MADGFRKMADVPFPRARSAPPRAAARGVSFSP
ncbi:hypothetical protein SCE1572_52720 [Sorangium cellulosum So0157-2]|uniref:Uncharacterized protein n=1 Tax=Sorangium cellulosum So0157-2 TaxID=1254432 RepID=S4YDJ5_SORCE|nr:hypothetical protein SCE1572_52720 [Sorangium cellulosum So0157-2]